MPVFDPLQYGYQIKMNTRWGDIVGSIDEQSDLTAAIEAASQGIKYSVQNFDTLNTNYPPGDEDDGTLAICRESWTDTTDKYGQGAGHVFTNGLYRADSGAWDFFDNLSLQDADEVPFTSLTGMSQTDVRAAIDYLNQILPLYTFEEKTTDYTVASSDLNKIFIYPLSLTAAKQVDLAAIANFNDCFVGVKNKSNYDITIVPDGTETINNAASIVVKPESTIILKPNSVTNWETTYWIPNEAGEWMNIELEDIDNFDVQFNPSNYNKGDGTFGQHLSGIDTRIGRKAIAKTTDYNAQLTDFLIKVSCSGGNVVISLPVGTAIDGAASVTINAQNECLTLYTPNTGGWIINIKRTDSTSNTLTVDCVGGGDSADDWIVL